MDLRQLRYFVGIVQAGSLSRAADQMHVAQSALSHHLASLETELDRQLVTRSPKGIVLTEAGAVLYRHAEAILRHIEFAKHDAASVLDVPSGRVSIGFPVAWAAIVGYELFTRIRAAYPQILLHVTDANSSLLRERLVNGRLDIAVLFVGESERGLVVEPLLMEELFYVTADPDPSPITLADIAARPMLVPGVGSGSHRVADQILRTRGLNPTSMGEIDSLNPLCRAIASGIGGAILPWCTLYDGTRRIALTSRRVADAELIRPVSICFPEVGQRNPAVDAVARTLRSLVEDLVKRGIWQGVSLVTGNQKSHLDRRSPHQNSELDALPRTHRVSLPDDERVS
jgi:LysR family transcriptional regulator, nitrogen assimilation regulatory protein